MFKRLLFADSAALFTLVAFITATSIYLTIGWRALRMKRPQRVQFADLPFSTPTPACGGEADPLGPPRFTFCVNSP